jgi:glycosyltransferase involved in cell wall biosynthesis
MKTGMTDLPRISVIIPTFNRAPLIERAIASVERQSLRPIEVLLIDDCSTDDTQQMVGTISSKIPIVYKRLEKNGGGAIARNAGIRLAKGDYVAFLDSDDEWESEHLKTLVSYTSREKGDFVVASSARLSEKDIILPKSAFPETSSVAQKLHFVLAGSLAFQTSTLLMPRDTAARFMFDGRLRRHQDWDLIFRMIRHQIALFLLPVPTTIYHLQTGANVSRSASIVPSLRFLARHRAAMSRRSVTRFISLEIDRRKANHIVALRSLLGAFLLGGLSTREFVAYSRERLRSLSSPKKRD